MSLDSIMNQNSGKEGITEECFIKVEYGGIKFEYTEWNNNKWIGFPINAFGVKWKELSGMYWTQAVLKADNYMFKFGWAGTAVSSSVASAKFKGWHSIWGLLGGWAFVSLYTTVAETSKLVGSGINAVGEWSSARSLDSRLSAMEDKLSTLESEINELEDSLKSSTENFTATKSSEVGEELSNIASRQEAAVTKISDAASSISDSLEVMRTHATSVSSHAVSNTTSASVEVI